MPSVDDFLDNATLACDIDRTIVHCLLASEIEVEDILHLVDKKEQILLNLISALEENQELAKHKEWQNAIESTQDTVRLMEEKTAELGQQLQKYRHGKKSLHQYKKFL